MRKLNSRQSGKNLVNLDVTEREPVDSKADDDHEGDGNHQKETSSTAREWLNMNNPSLAGIDPISLRQVR